MGGPDRKARRDAVVLFLLRPTVLLALVLLVGNPSLTLAGESETLSPAARKALTQGLAAAEEEQWALAIESFAEAQRATPFASTVLFNLGVAHANAGHDLTAVAWLRCYMAVAPTSGDLEAVRRQIEQLMSRVEWQIGQLSRVTIEVQKRLDAEGVQGGALRDFAALAARAALLVGNQSRAAEAIATVGDVGRRDALWTEVAADVTEQHEDLEMARWAVGQIQDPIERERVLACLFQAEMLMFGAVRPPGVSRELAEWHALVTLLSRRDHGKALEALANADVHELPLRLLRIATDLGADYRRVRGLEARYTTGTRN